ncbi:MAG: bifunctional glycosyltransferase family 2 protein/CDP-glycerol:glycerophosphate glycerophosphotransferase [Bacillota bacterium]|nr:bifunctional glycosyltransferase family 2 protein/CDP-glycerol:glycerophosphate glycerophosphotransferase [Bacillota bacterium]
MQNKELTDKKSPKLSVVVIAYNNELYIEEALESLHEQTFDDFEVCVVNDFSTDRTGEMIERFIEGKPKFKVVHLDKNSGGCSTPRNTGIANTTGEYIMFLDGDDWYTIDACEKMVAGIERTNSDFVAGQVIRTNNYQIWFHKQIYSDERTDINVREFPTLLFDTLSVNKIYKRSFLDKHGLRFPEGIHYEDIFFTGKAYFLANSVSVITEPIYYWRVVENAKVKSITNRRFEFANFKNRITAHRLYDQFLREHGDIYYQREKNNKFLRHDLKLYVNDYALYDEEYKVQFHKLIHDYLHEILDEFSFLSFAEKERIMYYLLYIGDKDAFQDYVYYIKGLPTAMDRVYSAGGSYYFKATNPNQNDMKFLELEKPESRFQISHIEMTDEAFSFEADVRVESISYSEITTYFTLKNKHTGAVINSRLSGNRISFPLDRMTPGNYYLHLNVIHQGNVIKYLVKRTDLVSLPNIKIQDNKLSKDLFINHKNTFGIKVYPLGLINRVKWVFVRKWDLVMQKKEYQDVVQKITNGFAKEFLKKLSIRRNWVLFESHMGKQYSDSPKYIYEEMYKQNRNYKYIWSFAKPDSVQLPGPAIKVKRNSLKHYYYLIRSKYWVDNQGMAHLTQKKKEQVYLQTWHGTPLKRMGYDQKTQQSDEEFARLKMQTNAWNYFISPNPYSTAIFRRAFRYGGKIIESGYPRNDILINMPEEVIQKTRSHFKIDPTKKVILYAPTFRDWDPNSYQKTIKDIQFLSETVDKNTVILLRLHYLLSSKLSHHALPKNVINASSYGDISELYLISDVLITDYSSVMFDYALLKRPIVFYCYDLEEYISRRGTYFDLAEKAPGPVCKTIDDVSSYLNNPEKLVDFKPALERFSSEFGSKEDGHAAAKVIEQVFDNK